MSDIAEAIRTLSGHDDLRYESVICKVSNVNTTNNTCTCTPIDGVSPEFYGVILSVSTSKGFLLIPKDLSLVVVSQISDATAYISMVSDVDQVYVAGDANGGLVKIQELTTKLNLLVSQLQAQLTLIAAGIVAGGGTYSPGTIATFNKIDYENIIVKHGNG